MDAQMIKKNLWQQKFKRIFLANIHCRESGNWITEKTRIPYIVEKIAWKSFLKSLREHVQRIIGFEKQKMLLLTNKELN